MDEYTRVDTFSMWIAYCNAHNNYHTQVDMIFQSGRMIPVIDRGIGVSDWDVNNIIKKKITILRRIK